MAIRKQITLLYKYDDNWIGGSYYILNIIKALNALDDIEKPELLIIYNSEKSLDFIHDIKYPYISFNYFNPIYSISDRILNRFGISLFGRDIIKKKIQLDKVKNLYPINVSIDISNIDGFYFWIPDFQEWYLPNFFSRKEVQYRKKNQKFLERKAYPLVFSSNNALNDFNKFYPNNTNRKEVLRFVSVIEDDYTKLDISVLKEKFNINREYFIIPNQFWKHKNHKIVVEAAKLLKEKNEDFLFVFTGKEFDYRNPDYVDNLKEDIKNKGLEDNFRFLGFIDRAEQLQLMKNSIAVVQPSLFEGWSTVVEDVKALNHAIILSDIPLHREQITNNCLFFNPLDKLDLANKLLHSMNYNLITFTFDVEAEQLQVAKKIISIF